MPRRWRGRRELCAGSILLKAMPGRVQSTQGMQQPRTPRRTLGRIMLSTRPRPRPRQRQRQAKRGEQQPGRAKQQQSPRRSCDDHDDAHTAVSVRCTACKGSGNGIYHTRHAWIGEREREREQYALSPQVRSASSLVNKLSPLLFPMSPLLLSSSASPRLLHACGGRHRGSVRNSFPERMDCIRRHCRGLSPPRLWVRTPPKISRRRSAC